MDGHSFKYDIAERVVKMMLSDAIFRLDPLDGTNALIYKITSINNKRITISNVSPKMVRGETSLTWKQMQEVLAKHDEM